MGYEDVAGGILVRSAGLNAEMLEPLMYIAEVHSIMSETLFSSRTQ
ncbi:MAG: hypothetical protein QNI90_17860 [Dinoroseobacter sp.]|nr:hypothetical protein [Dinoroseobacter sp.]